jgi:hypothetical protein
MIPLLTEAANTKERWPERIDGAAAVGDGIGSTGIDEIEGEIGGSHPPINSTLNGTIGADRRLWRHRRPTLTRPSINE